MNYILKYIIIAFGIVWIEQKPGISQTCCSGGVPLSGNIGFEGAARGTLQLELSYDLNYLSTLKNGSEIYEDEIRQRITHSLLLKSGYSVNDWLAIDALFSYVFQGRRITFDDQISQTNTHGFGDAVLMAKFILSRISDQGSELQLGIGPKLPLGRTDLTNSSGITLNADMQPGSGSWDLITWSYFARQFVKRTSLVASVRLVGKFNGQNRKYFDSQTYRFGNSTQLFMGMGDQLLWKNLLFSPSISLRFRYAWSDLINGQELANTGGQWINIIPALSVHLGPKSIVHFIPELPLYSHVEGTQLTPTFRMQLGLYHSIGTRKRNMSNIYQL